MTSAPPVNMNGSRPPGAMSRPQIPLFFLSYRVVFMHGTGYTLRIEWGKRSRQWTWGVKDGPR